MGKLALLAVVASMFAGCGDDNRMAGDRPLLDHEEARTGDPASSQSGQSLRQPRGTSGQGTAASGAESDRAGSPTPHAQ